MHEKIKQEEETEKYKLFLKQGVCVNINFSFIWILHFKVFERCICLSSLLKLIILTSVVPQNLTCELSLVLVVIGMAHYIFPV